MCIYLYIYTYSGYIHAGQCFQSFSSVVLCLGECYGHSDTTTYYTRCTRDITSLLPDPWTQWFFLLADTRELITSSRLTTATTTWIIVRWHHSSQWFFQPPPPCLPLTLIPLDPSRTTLFIIRSISARDTRIFARHSHRDKKTHGTAYKIDRN